MDWALCDCMVRWMCARSAKMEKGSFVKVCERIERLRTSLLSSVYQMLDHMLRQTAFYVAYKLTKRNHASQSSIINSIISHTYFRTNPQRRLACWNLTNDWLKCATSLATEGPRSTHRNPLPHTWRLLTKLTVHVTNKAWVSVLPLKVINSTTKNSLLNKSEKHRTMTDPKAGPIVGNSLSPGSLLRVTYGNLVWFYDTPSFFVWWA